ncbi:MAG: T9SS type A sorting domain-containing protein [Chitinophagaceae bacterium]
MKKILILFSVCLLAFTNMRALDPNHFTITRITAPYFIVDGNSPTTITKAYVGFEVKNNSNSATTYPGLKFTITSIGTSVVGQNYSIVSPATGIVNVGTLAPGESKVCYYYVSYPANTTPIATFNVQLSDNTASWKTTSFQVRNRSSISANAGGTATQTFTNQDLIGGLVIDDVTYVVGNVQNLDESDFQVAVSAQFDPTKVTLLSTQVIASSVPGINNGTTDSLYFVTGNGSNGATITVRWIFRITGTNFTTYLLPCAGATSGSTNYKYALNTSLGQGTPITVSSTANPLTIAKTADQSVYGINSPAIFTITIGNPGAYGITIDRITDEIPAGFTFQALHATSQVTASNSTSIPGSGATGTVSFDGGVTSAGNNSYYIPAGGSLILKYTALTPSYSTSNLLTTARDYVGATQVGAATNTVSVSTTLPLSLLSFSAVWMNDVVRLNWSTSNEINCRSMQIERSTDNTNYTQIGELPATGNTSSVQDYSFTDPFPVMVNKYRLKLVDLDGKFTYSPVVLVTKKQGDASLLSSFPNPFTNVLNIQVVSPGEQTIRLQLTDILGKTIFTRSEPCPKGTHTFMLHDLGNIPTGIYFLQVTTPGGKKQFKLLKTE